MLTDRLSVLQAGDDREAAAVPALIAADRPISFAELAGRVRTAIPALRGAGVEPGALVALRATNRVETVVVIHALAELRAPLAAVHPRATEVEAAQLVEDAQPRLVLDDAKVDALLAGAPDPGAPVPAGGAAVHAILYTSGTTGRPKGAVLGREAFVASAAASAKNLGWAHDDRWLLCMPLCHVGGLSILTRCTIARRPVILEPRFDSAAVLEAARRHRATLLSVVPTMLHALLEEDRAGVLAQLRAILVGGAAAPPALLEECARRGVRALTTYGLTEACSQVTAQGPASAGEPGCGRPLEGVELEITDGSGRPLPRGEDGLIRVRGATRMRGYLGHPALDPGAWIDTGDLGVLDEAGRLIVHARRSDLIVTGGENVYPAEIEHVLATCTGVRGAIVFGDPDERWGQVVAAAILADPSQPIDAARLARELAAVLAPHKRPRRVCFVDRLPMGPSGKPDRAGAAAELGKRLGALQMAPTAKG